MAQSTGPTAKWKSLFLRPYIYTYTYLYAYVTRLQGCLLKEQHSLRHAHAHAHAHAGCVCVSRVPSRRAMTLKLNMCCYTCAGVLLYVCSRPAYQDMLA